MIFVFWKSKRFSVVSDTCSGVQILSNFNCNCLKCDLMAFSLYQISNFEAGRMSVFSANSVVSDLQNISYTASPIYGGDILLVYRLTKVLLEYEMRQKGLRMISQQYRDFVQVDK